MTKSTKHKKARVADFKKLKVKVGKRLQKAQNETKTDFKARKIILKEQLALKPTSKLATKKNLNIKDLLSHISHHSVYVRQDGLNGMKELASTNTKDDLYPFLSTLLNGVVPCILDTDQLIRKTAVKIIEILITKVGPLIQPYFSLLTSHLSCAMVHLHTGVQSDSLQLMDVMLSQTPSLIAQNSNTLLDNYLSLISRKINKSQTVKKSIVSHTLISNPSSRLATLKWRIKLLKSLSKYLEAILGEKTKLEASVPLTLWQVVTIGCLPPLIKGDGSRLSAQGIKLLTEEKHAMSFVTTLIPLLFQIWAEVHSSDEKVIQGNPLDFAAIQMLHCISEIILHLMNVTELVTNQDPLHCEWFMQTLKTQLKPQILEGFPYCPLEAVSSVEKEEEDKGSTWECQQLNATLATLCFSFAKGNSSLRNRVAAFYIDIFSNMSGSSDCKLANVVVTASSLLEKNSGISRQLSERLLEASVHCYQNLSPKMRKYLLKMPLTASDHSCQHLWGSKALKKWMSVLVCSAFSDNLNQEPILEVLLQFKLRNSPGFTEVMASNKNTFHENMEKYRLENPDHQEKMVVIV